MGQFEILMGLFIAENKSKKRFRRESLRKLCFSGSLR